LRQFCLCGDAVVNDQAAATVASAWFFARGRQFGKGCQGHAQSL